MVIGSQWILVFYYFQIIYILQQICIMQGHFKFGHTIVPEQENQSSEEDLANLFKIGNKQIIVKHNKEDQSDDESHSDSTIKEKHIHKENKEKKQKNTAKNKEDKKEKKEKKDKKEKKEKKDKKEKKEKKHKNLIQIADDDEGRLQIYKDTQAISKYQRYSALMKKSLQQQIAQKQFQLNIKVGQGLLKVDIIKFPQNNLYLYGIMDKDIPRYNRLQNFQSIIGVKQSKQKKYKHIIKDLNKIINQKNINPYEDQISKNRYFNYQGYQNCGAEKIGAQSSPIDSALIKFNIKEQTNYSEEDKFMQINRQFNRRLNQNIKNIDLWLQFIDIQESMSQATGSSKNKTAILQRKISILEKALQHNPFNQRLGLLYLNLLYSKHNDGKQIISSCQQFIKHRPACVQLWKLFFSLHIQQFRTFSHSYIRTVYEEINEQFKQTIDGTKSAIEIWKIRKACLQVLRSTLLIYKLEGFTQMATGSIIAVIQYNIFMPEEVVKITSAKDKLKQFCSYWQNYQNYKLGQIKQQANWSHQVTTLNQKLNFIGQFEQKLDGLAFNKKTIMKEIQQNRTIWRPSHAKEDKQIIEKYPQSYVLVEDIEHALMLYRDNQSLTSLIDILTDHLQLPNLFTATNLYSQFTFKYIQSTLHRLFTTDCSNSTHNINQFYFWQKYWNPMVTQSIVPKHNYVKLQFLRRILISAKQKMPTHKQKLNQYICFISCAIYINSQLQQSLKTNQSQSLHYIEEILSEDPLNQAVWAMYIETTYLLKGNTQQCINCYLQLFDTSKILIVNAQERSKYNYQILYWFYSFSFRNKLEKESNILKIYLKLVKNQELQCVQLSESLNNLDCLYLQHHFKEQINNISNIEPTNKVIKQTNLINERVRSQLFLIAYLQLYDYSPLFQNKQQITQHLIETMTKQYSYQTNNQQFILSVLLTHKLLTIQHIMSHELLKHAPYLSLVQYWISLYRKPLVLFESELDQLPYRNLVIWLSSVIFLWKRSCISSYFYEFFYSYSKKICYQDKITDQYPQYIILLNSLLLYDVNQNHQQFFVYSLNHVPFGKQLYLINLMTNSNQSEKRKMKSIIEQKGIRILNPQILL